MNDDDILWEKIKEKRDRYFVSYSPPHPSSWLAHLRVVILEPLEKTQLAEILEQEFGLWAKQYPVPLYGTLSNEEDDGFDLSGIRPTDTITGYFDPDERKLTSFWGLLKNEEIPEKLKAKEYQITVFNGLPHKTGKQVREGAQEYAKKMQTTNRVLLGISFIKIFVLPFIKGLLGVVGTIYDYGKGALEFLKLKGTIKRSKREKELSEKELLHRHYIYHCEQNPEGFVRLRNENLARDIREKIRKEADEISKNN